MNTQSKDNLYKDSENYLTECSVIYISILQYGII